MKKHLASIFLGIFLLLNLAVKSQSLGIDSASTNLLSLPDTINLNDNYNHTILVRNNGATPLTGTIYLVAAVDTAGTLNSIDTVATATVTNFTLGDTIGLTYNEIYNTINGYKLGSNIIVVWPIANVGTTTDSLTKNVFILNAISTGEINAKESPLIYPNPVKNYLYFDNFTQYSGIKQVRIYDVSGHLVYHKKLVSKLNVSQLPRGVYFLTLQLKKEEFHYKLIKE